MKTIAPLFIDRDLSWLSFNARVLSEAEKDTVPLMERLNFLSIFSSNLDEFYKVRIPKLLVGKDKTLLKDIHKEIIKQQEFFGTILFNKILPQLQKNNIDLIYNKPIPIFMKGRLIQYFTNSLAPAIELYPLPLKDNFLIKSNSLYQIIFITLEDGKEEMYILKIPDHKFPRFYETERNNCRYVVFIDDILKTFLPEIYFSNTAVNIWNFKVTRDANINFEKEEDLLENLEIYLKNREKGKTTRFLYEKDMPIKKLQKLLSQLNIPLRDAVPGSAYHHLKDLNMISTEDKEAFYPPMRSIERHPDQTSVFDLINEQDLMIHTPYESYDKVIDFFMEAATDEKVTEMYITIYRTAKDSAIIEALMIAAKLGKKVTVFIELKARFDEENNLKWLWKMKNAGVHIITSIPKLKVHAKVALVKKNKEKYALISTGNFNESTARYYTDHILFTANPDISGEMETFFNFLIKKRKPLSSDELTFNHLAVGQFNLMSCILEMIDKEIQNHKMGKPSGIIIKVNNLEEVVIISKLYEASQAGVKVELIVRGICCLVPAIPGQSQNIKVIRIVDRYLEHGRIFIFRNAGDDHILIGSSDIMNRSMYERIEVLCPVYSPQLKYEIMEIIRLQLKDNVKATEINLEMDNKPVVPSNSLMIRSQYDIYDHIQQNFTE
ncbi:polyphosphate kinase 1 [Chryseobacterium phosphatilyticum]|uniref:Polyphosphate kinase n=1 Tax=Chryseobacterium phosphatilyticum TaxID=475075 RepID=A0A316XI98_9FLAO|nr:polyphosphate kinase 1 [Chryseobacterium phosphatilyticum]PWN71893.1 polyphosphate kinase 1 [Chryseobacterium phosphatilyticum]